MIGNLADVQFINQSQEKYNYSNYFCTIYCSKRDELAIYLLEAGVYSSFRYWPINKIPFFKESCKNREFTNSNYMAYNALNIPIHEVLTSSEIKKI